MGVRYFRHTDPCPHCHRADPPELIGQAAPGFRVLFHAGKGLPHSWRGWKQRCQEGKIVTDKGVEVPLPALVAIVEMRAGDAAPEPVSFRDSEGHPFVKEG